MNKYVGTSKVSRKNLTTSGKQRGMTLLEVIIVLGIMGIIAAGVVVLAQRAIDNQNVTKLSQALNVVQTAMVQSFRSQKSYPESNSEASSDKLSKALISMGKVTKADLSNPFTGEKLQILTTSDRKAKNRGFAIKVANLSQNQCRSLISSSHELFSFIEVNTAGSGNIAEDMYVEPDASADTGVIKSTKGGSDQFDVTNLEHLSALCGGDSGESQYYDVYVGNR